ncbi:hypothetical protein SAMN04488122_5613 [Chitinophaga arvensicola]|uniref:Uncharacterized protein n=1 Tax=Chitinophaga arvensicola TaxID=29529 RepID=A0A1I0SAN1_9BACT|nr:hypothetical protein SAMN04488122_5613 [Chitinophaga arvensicola]
MVFQIVAQILLNFILRISCFNITTFVLFKKNILFYAREKIVLKN